MSSKPPDAVARVVIGIVVFVVIVVALWAGTKFAPRETIWFLIAVVGVIAVIFLAKHKELASGVCSIAAVCLAGYFLVQCSKVLQQPRVVAAPAPKPASTQQASSYTYMQPQPQPEIQPLVTELEPEPEAAQVTRLSVTAPSKEWSQSITVPDGYIAQITFDIGRINVQTNNNMVQKFFRNPSVTSERNYRGNTIVLNPLASLDKTPRTINLAGDVRSFKVMSLEKAGGKVQVEFFKN